MLSTIIRRPGRSANLISPAWRTSAPITKVPHRKCGLFAAFSPSPREEERTSEDTVKRMCKRIEHRGPDGTGMAFGSWGQAGRWALGHTRLAIVAPDEKSANQPFEHPTTAMVANGEIYNHKDVYARLEKEYGYTGTPLSHSDCEVVAHAYKVMGADKMARSLDGMFAFVLIDYENNTFVAGRDPTGIKPLYYACSSDGTIVGFASELKALVDLYGIANIYEFPNGHYYTPEAGFVKYYDPEWQYYVTESGATKEAPWVLNEEPTAEELRESLDKAVKKRLMADVDFGLFLSGGVDSCIVGQLMLKHCRDMGYPHPNSYTIGMEDGPDLMAARAMSKELGTKHHERIFNVQEAFAVIEKVVYHIETYNAELIRSAIPNYFLAERAAADVKMVITGEGADEMWAGYAYFEDAPSPEAMHKELCRIYNHLGVANLLRADRMTMAHGLEARVPFLDVQHTAMAMKLDPRKKLITKGGAPEQREKAYLRHMFDRPHDGITIPKPVLWRMKAMQCEGIGEDWVSILQRKVSEKVSDAAMAEASKRFPHETPQTKEEYFYRELFDNYFPNCEKVPQMWEGGYRAGGAEWKSTAYTREGLKEVGRLTHALQGKSTQQSA
mmetsp:Transcript_16961/g.34348  ORF Transcript_16961/g.34348 Transcript_16961/m.34348 type:complete len:612 (-) Transcript_16961:73-1908(-)